MSLTDNYNAAASLTAYYPSRDTRAIARHWAREKLLHDMADMGFVTFFEGSGSSPSVLAGYSTAKLWLHTQPGVTTLPGVVRIYDGSGDPTLLASWPEMDGTGLRTHLDVYSKAEISALFTALGTIVSLRGDWDASSGSFPASVSAGYSYIVSVAGTVDSVAFTVGDRIVALVDSASTSTYAANWLKLDYTDLVSSVAGKTGAVVLEAADISDATAPGQAILTAATYAAIRALLDLEAGTDFHSVTDLVSTANAKGASLIGIEDSGGLITATTVEGALAEIQAALDAAEADIAGMSNAVVLKGTWDASAGTFPGSGAALAGWSYIVSTGGTVDSVAFVAGDRIVAITDNASTSTYASNWHHLDYTDAVSSVAGNTGAVSAAQIEAAYASVRAQVSAGEKTAGTETALRTFSPQDIADMAGTHGGGGGGGAGASASVYKSATQSISNATTTTLTWNLEYFDTDTIHDNATNNSRLTATTTGKYFFVAAIVFGSNNTGIRQLTVNKNGSLAQQQIFPNNGSGQDQTSMSGVVSLAATDYLEVLAWQNSGGSLNVETSSYFSMAKVDD